jgi:uncharacterized protein YdiU (UPF0061 family)
MSSSQNQFGWNFDNTYSRLPDLFFERVKPSSVSNPKLVLFNRELAQVLELNSENLEPQGQNYFSGQILFEGSEPLAQAYAGHQFGHFNMLGDGRAHLLGEHVTSKGERFDIQLKGSGSTRFSRRGDGLAALAPMLREYIISEAMAAFKIPTTRSLAVVATGDQVVRETLLPGGILTRVASSHIRVGTFQYAAAFEEGKYLRNLADYTIQRHYPDLLNHPEPYIALLKAVIERQASLIVQWMLVGFIHGVMNTDNMTLSGETIDYGPCAFMDQYSLATVFSSIDRQARYAYGQQPGIAHWNLSRLAEAMLPLFSSEEEKAIAKAEEALDTFAGHLQQNWQKGMSEKLGITIENNEDIALMTSLLQLMEKNQADYTNTLRALSNGKMPDEPLAKDSAFLDWHQKWLSKKPDLNLMLTRNPAVIPRNHFVERALAAAVEKEDYSVIKELLEVLKSPFVEPTDVAEYTSPAPNGGAGYKTFCGT